MSMGWDFYIPLKSLHVVYRKLQRLEFCFPKIMHIWVVFMFWFAEVGSMCPEVSNKRSENEDCGAHMGSSAQDGENEQYLS